MRRTPSARDALRAALVAALSAVLLVGLVGAANAAPRTAAGAGASECKGRGVPVSKVSVQLWTFAEHVGFGTDAATQARHEDVLRRLSAMGYRNVEPFTLNGYPAAQYAALLEEYGLKASSRHVNVGTPSDPADITAIIRDNRTLGIKYFGSGGTPRLTTEADWVAYAQYLNRVGEQARKAGQTLLVHNHDWEFTTVFGDRTAYDVLVQHTAKKNVVFQLDLYWAAFAGQDPEALIERYGNRIQLLHVKDLRGSDRRIEIVGRGVLDFPSYLRAAGGSTRYHVVEHDPRFGDRTFDPFVAAQEGFSYLRCVRL